MQEEHVCITISDRDTWSGDRWEMTFDLTAIMADTGVKRDEKWQDDKGVWHYDRSMKLSTRKAKKIAKTILEFGTAEDIKKCDEVFRHNLTLYRIWKELLA